MLNVKVLGPGCPNCKQLEQRVQRVARELGAAVEIEKVTDYEEIMKWDILQTPGLVINDRLVAAGRIPAEQEIAKWLSSATG